MSSSESTSSSAEQGVPETSGFPTTPGFSDSDHEFMARAIMLARQGWNSTTPNPRVGCVLVRDGAIVADGWHERAGEAHAEAMALQKAGSKAKGLTAYITLEPCDFVGRTPACGQSLIDAGITRVVCAMQDPHARVSGGGFARLRAAGIAVEVGLLEQSAADLNPGYIKRQQTGMPRVVCKLAMSLDGRTAMANGESQWITGPEARRDVQMLRAESCAIITGINTVVTDNPRMTVRHEEFTEASIASMQGRQPLRVIIDSSARCPADHAILHEPGNVVLAVGRDTEVPSALMDNEKIQLLRSDAARPDLADILQALAEQDCNEVLVESGPVLAGAFLKAGLIDELRIYMAAKLMGSDARPLFDLPLQSMADSIELQTAAVKLVGEDVRFDLQPVYKT